ncbi:MAG: thiamine diphosphokinase [Eubacterium sp.]|nr:thiamine diphosphokinase [Eubacterium sp.]
MERICYIVGAGDNAGTNFLKGKNDYVIAADGGLLWLQKLNIEPDLIMGDFDSLGFVPKGNNVIQHEVMKNDTDMMLAVKQALEMGYHKIKIYGGTGGRIDHTLSNIQTMLYASRKGASIEMIDSTNIYYVITDGEIQITGESQSGFSIFALGGIAHKVNIKDAMYLLHDFELAPDNPTGTSNSFIGKEVTISVEKGSLLIVI